MKVCGWVNKKKRKRIPLINCKANSNIWTCLPPTMYIFSKFIWPFIFTTYRWRDIAYSRFYPELRHGTTVIFTTFTWSTCETSAATTSVQLNWTFPQVQYIVVWTFSDPLKKQSMLHDFARIHIYREDMMYIYFACVQTWPQTTDFKDIYTMWD